MDVCLRKTELWDTVLIFMEQYEYVFCSWITFLTPILYTGVVYNLEQHINWTCFFFYKGTLTDNRVRNRYRVRKLLDWSIRNHRKSDWISGFIPTSFLFVNPNSCFDICSTSTKYTGFVCRNNWCDPNHSVQSTRNICKQYFANSFVLVLTIDTLKVLFKQPCIFVFRKTNL